MDGTSANDEAIRPLGPPVLAGSRRLPTGATCRLCAAALSNTRVIRRGGNGARSRLYMVGGTGLEPVTSAV